MLILGLLGMHFDAVVVFVTNSSLFQISSGHTVLDQDQGYLLVIFWQKQYSFVSIHNVYVLFLVFLLFCFTCLDFSSLVDSQFC